MPQERYSSNEWGLSQIEYAQREKHRLRERMKKRAQRARIKMTPPPMVCEQLVEKYVTFRLKGQDIQELDIVAVVTKTFKRPDPMSRYYPPVAVPMSLPWVSMLYGAR
ncbi:hypothetical protein EJ076_34860 [Mesorhizobium sp. M7D.F.Ca.US.005.01.1.1]|uniref:hypothetical protein n=1 Tax=Mesorhizobium sp. M7D.F.Ca.US.005.01.1.1 TaxID=2493678 RepID=UPI000F74C923|nr:hypothetical protein [Mesorhizobium sp. M7D.F.Ca.US.005.01.1.1]AZO45899.1 hypothetical protein EJ076_34860 [Mesorhizobium sp. M7D.F.Ca.US.005.01.1.1]